MITADDTFLSDRITAFATQGAERMAEPSRAQQMMGDIAPKFVSLNDDVLFGDIWERPELSPRDRSLITVSALVSMYRTNQMAFHFQKALENGVTKEELVEAITHLAFYAGWPNASTAMTTLKKVVEDAE
jgi:4-carboxymuconolactone decarboxylase